MSRALAALAFAVAFVCLTPSCAAPSPTPPALREATASIRVSAMGAADKDWPAIERTIVASLGHHATPDAYRRAAVAALGDPHASYLTPTEAEAWRSGAPPDRPAEAPTDTQASAEAAAPAPAPTVPNEPWGQLLDGAVGYIALPPCATGDPDRLRAYAVALRTLLAARAQEGAESWIIDLRLCGGGNVWPMLAGLAPLLPTGPVVRSVEPGAPGDARDSIIGVDGRSAWLDTGAGPVVQHSIDPESVPSPPAPLHDEPLAVLIGPWTMSSGEMVAIALGSRAGARTFGESTAGLTTATGFFPFADGGVLILPTSRMAPLRAEPLLGAITPDEPAPFGDWPTPDDAAARAAMRWLADRAP